MPTKINFPGELNSRFNFFVKREDLHPLGSHKHFAAKAQVEYMTSKHAMGGVISTSGNAGICLGHFAKDAGEDLYVITSDHCKPEKLEVMVEKCEHLFLSKNPARICNYISSKYGFENLRPSIDDAAINGFENLGFELYEQFVGFYDGGKMGEFWSEIYTFSTSGASYIGMFNSFKELHKKNFIKKIPKMHCVTGFAGRLGLKNSPRQKRVDEILGKTDGQKVEIGEDELKNFKKKFPDIKLSEESLSSIAAALNNNATENSLVISTGKKWESKNSDFDKSIVQRLDSLEDCDKFFFKIHRAGKT